jgi:hypothetical protein
MDLNGPVYSNMREVVKDVDTIVKELISVASRPKKDEDDRKMLQTLSKLFAKKEHEFDKLSKIYEHRYKVKTYIEELKKVSKVQDKKLQILSEGFGKMYNNLGEMKRRVDVQLSTCRPETSLNTEDIIKTAHLYSRSHSVAAPNKNTNRLRPYPTVEELKKGRLGVSFLSSIVPLQV